MDEAKKKVISTNDINIKYYKNRSLRQRIHLDAKVDYYRAMNELKMLFECQTEFERWMIDNIGDNYF